MFLKDHFAALEISPGATPEEIKHAYRRLVMVYHPDRNPGDPYAIAKFNEIREAYETLVNPAKKEQYLQQRWYHQSLGKKKTFGAITPVAVYKQLLELEQYVSRLDGYRVNHEGLAAYLKEWLNEETLDKLNSFGHESMRPEIFNVLLNICRQMPYNVLLVILPIFSRLVETHDTGKKEISNLLLKRKNAERWVKLQPLVILLLCLLICLIILLVAR